MTGSELLAKYAAGERGFYRADLGGANLRGADLGGANLRGANLRDIKYDIYNVIDHAPLELAFMIAALERGEIDGSTYHSDCNQGCLVGMLLISAAQRTDVEWDHTGLDIPMDSSRPAERWFLAITPGKTPENDPIAQITHGWLKERLAFYGRLAATWPRAEG